MESITITVTDDAGETLQFYEYNGIRHPAFAKDVVKKFKNVQFREDDILLFAYPKSGTHWLWENIRLLVAGNLDQSNIQKRSQMIDVTPEEDYKDIPSPRILNSHLQFRNLPEDFQTKKPKIIHIMRNPKDVTVSLYNDLLKMPKANYKGKWENYFRPAVEGRFLFRPWFDYVKDWETVEQTFPDLSILTLSYEDLKEDLMREMSKVNRFLGLERSEEFIRQVCEQCEFSSMKKIKQSSGERDIFRKGQVGDWKNWFTVAQNEWFDQLYQEEMKDSNLQIRFSL